jgi:sulfatase-like protein
MALSLSEAARHQLKNLVTAFSLGTLVFIRRWYDMENLNLLEAGGLNYFRSAPPGITLLISTILSSLVVSAVFWLAWLWVERHSTPGRRRFAHCAFLLVLLFPLESVRRYWNTVTGKFDVGSNVALWAVEGVVAAGFVMLLFGNTRVVYPARKVATWLTLLLPALLIDFTMTRLGMEPPDAYAPRPPAAMLPSRPSSPRIVWLVFDELDQHMVFDRRPADLELPEIDRLRSEGLMADHAAEISTHTTIALPSLLSGRLFTEAHPGGADVLQLQPEGSKQPVAWESQANVFGRARDLGVNSALAGWHHPYCRVIGDQLVHCFAVPSTHSTAALTVEAHAERDGVRGTIPRLFQRQLYNLADMLHSSEEPNSERFRDTEIQQDQQRQYLAIREAAYREAADPRVGLLFVHFPTPHPFPIYDRRSHTFELRAGLDYFDNLALVDRTIGELRRTLEQAGLWKRTALLIGGDHGLRAAQWKGQLGWTEEMDRLAGAYTPLDVPFLLRLPGSTQPATVTRSFSSVISAEVVLSVLRGEISTPAQAAAWLEGHVRSAAVSATLKDR